MMRYLTEEQPEFDHGPPSDSPLSDMRRMANEIIRVLLLRKWLFFVPCCLGITTALMISQQVQTRFLSKTIFERRDNIVISNLVQKDMPHSFDTLRRSLTYDLTRDEAVQKAVEQTSYVQSLPRTDSGKFTDESRQERAKLIRDVNRNIKIRMLEKSNHLDFIEVAYVGFDPLMSAEIVNALRDNYIEHTRERIASILSDATSFFREQIAIHQEEESSLDLQRTQFEAGFIGIDLRDPNSLRDQIKFAKKKRDELERRKKELLADMDGRTKFLNGAGSVEVGSETENLELAVLGDPEVVGITSEIRSIKTQIDQLKRNRRMTDLHPSMIPLNTARANLELELQDAKAAALDRIKNEASADNPQGAVAGTAGSMDDRRVKMEMNALQNMISFNEEDAQAVQEKIDYLNSLVGTLGGKRKEYLAITQNIEAAKGALAVWENNLAQVLRIQDAEINDRGIGFNTIEAARPSERPFSPRWITVWLFCLATGTLLGTAGVLLAELFDRTLRTSDQVANALGVPVISDVAEILSPAVIRRRLIKRVLLQPVLAVALLLLVSFAGLSTYLHIERPDQFSSLMERPSETLMQFLGMS